MASRPLLTPHSVITNGSMAGSLTSQVTIIQMLSMMSYDVSWTGAAPVGTLSVQVSNTYSQNADGTTRNAGNWTTLILNVGGTPATTIPVSGSPGNVFIDIDELGAYAIRLVYTRTSGTGILNAVIAAKVS